MISPRPLFLVGMPRSGTKLLRTILNNHPQIGIATSETEFLPNWIQEWQSYGDLSLRENFHKFFARSMRFPYFQNQRRKNCVIEEQAWYSACSAYDLPTVFSQLVLHNIEHKPNLRYWGDKSPGYTYWIREINDNFPEARFVHIVRDPRDYASSVRTAWGRNLLRAVQQWKEGTRKVERDRQIPGVRLYTLKFEELLDNPERTIRQLCGFLELEFLPEMLSVGRVESVGDAKGRTGIVQENKNKFSDTLSDSEIRQIERICGIAMERFGYEVAFEKGDRDVPPWKLAWIRVLDSLNVIRSNSKRRGWAYGLKHAILFRLMKMKTSKSRKDLLK